MNYAFIDNNAALGDRERKQIRSHVMLGKNLGRRLPPRGRKRTAPHRPEPQARDDDDDDDDDDDRPANTTSRSAPEAVRDGAETRAVASRDPPGPATTTYQSRLLMTAESTRIEVVGAGTGPAGPFSPFAGTEFDYFASHTQSTSSTRFLLHEFFNGVHDALYPPDICHRAPNDTPLWLRYIAINKAFLHATLGISATYVVLFRGQNSRASLEAAWHFAQALRLVNRDLSRSMSLTPPPCSGPEPNAPPPPPPPDSTLAVVVSLAIHANLTGGAHAGRVHLDGLQRLLALCPAGGIAALYGVNLALAQKICRSDIEFALLEGMPTRFGPALAEVLARTRPAAMLLGGAGEDPHRLAPSTICNLRELLPRLSPALRDVTRDMRDFCRALAAPDKPAALSYQASLISISYRLLDMAPLGSAIRPPDSLDDAWQLGLVAFMTTLMYSTSHWRVIHFGLLSRLLRERLLAGFAGSRGNAEDGEEDARWFLPLRFWLFSIYGYVVVLESEGFDGRWLFPQLRSLAGRLGVETWVDARAHLTRFPWVAAIHDELGKRLWNVVMPPVPAPATTVAAVAAVAAEGEEGRKGEYVNYLAVGL